MLEIGIRGKKEVLASEENSAKTIGSGTLNVFATPAMIALMERTAWESVAGQLEEGSSTVGISMNVEHLSPTPLGMKLYCESELVNIEGRKLSFMLKVHDERGLVGEGTHERFIVQSEKFQKKADEK